ncbi:MAG: lyase family protein, partial [Pseudomonadota bacterium]|nr:lyase family protein [Pseudomonadota bacterium]
MTKQGNKSNSTSSIWGGRFSGTQDDLMVAVNASIDFDQRLYEQDITGSEAHAKMLVEKGIISASDGESILSGLATIRDEIRNGQFTFSHALEDIHMNIEARLKTLIGDAAGRLHTARSRNDQVATDLRLWVRQQCDDIDKALADLQKALMDQAEHH